MDTAILLLFALLLLLAVIPLSASEPTSLFDFNNFIGSNLLLEGGASVSSDGCLRLVGSSNYSGQASYPSKLLLWGSSGISQFTTDFTFTSGSGGGALGDPPADCGISFRLNGDAGNYLAVKFDCSDKVNIEIDSPPAVASQSLPQNLTASSDRNRGRVVYNAQSGTLSVFLSPAGTPVLSYAIDLSKSLPEQVSLQLSGEGDEYRLQTVFSWSFTSEFVSTPDTLPAANPPNPAPATATPSPTTSDSAKTADTSPSPTGSKSDPTRPKRIGTIVGSILAVVVAALGAGACFKKFYINIKISHQTHNTTNTNITTKSQGPAPKGHESG